MEYILITGAARRLGAFFATKLASEGSFIWIHYHTHEAEALSLRKKIIDEGGQAECVCCDLKNTADIDRMLNLISESGQGKLTTLINNASYFLNKKIQETSIDEWDDVMNTNLKATWYLSKQFVEQFPTAKRIISIGDASTANPMPLHAVYALSKKSLKYLTEQLAAAYAPKIYINILSPGFVMKGDLESESVWEKRQSRTLTENSHIQNQIYEGIRFLMTDPGMTGAELLVDNGVHLYYKNEI